jgi:type IX secretion system PorP/SprF family membrane protein
MKKALLILISLLPGIAAIAQQTPLSENYFMDRYSLMPSYAGNFNQKYLVAGYRSDWSGITGGPKTLRFTFNDAASFMNNAGYGARLVFDKAGIFNQLYIMGSYSYKVKLVEDHFLMFGLSMGIYHNTINLTDYYNDPDFTIDPSLVSLDVKSKIKFMSDFSVLYNWKNLETGFLFSNMSFGDASYEDVALKYNPLANFQLHATYQYEFAADWSVAPLMILRGGKNIKSQFELAAQVSYLKRVWGSLTFRDPGILGFGIGGEVIKGLRLAYNFNFATNVIMGAFNNHEVALGINVFEYIGKK